MTLETSRTYKALTKSNNLFWGGDKFLMKILLTISFILIILVRGWFGYTFGPCLLFFGRAGLVMLAKKDPDYIPVLMNNLFAGKFFMSRALFPGRYTTNIRTFDVVKERLVSGVPFYWRIYYFIFPTSGRKPSKLLKLFKK